MKNADHQLQVFSKLPLGEFKEFTNNSKDDPPSVYQYGGGDPGFGGSDDPGGLDASGALKNTGRVDAPARLDVSWVAVATCGTFTGFINCHFTAIAILIITSFSFSLSQSNQITLSVAPLLAISS